MIRPITPSLWFDTQAEEAANFYCSLFTPSSVKSITRYSKEGFEFHKRPEGSVLTVAFQLAGLPFTALNGGPQFAFNPSVSFYVVCRTEQEADALWNSLQEGGSVMMPLDKYPWSAKYGWLNDRFGLSWQVAVHEEEKFEDKISPAFLFMGENQPKGEEALQFYTSLFPGSSVVHIARFEEGEGSIPGTIKHAMFKLNHQTFMIMGSSMQHAFDFNEAVSFQVLCDTQQEIDHYWHAFADGGLESQCGWVKDRFGVWWQVVPAILPKLLSDPAKAGNVMNAFLQMKKFDIEQLLQA